MHRSVNLCNLLVLISHKKQGFIQHDHQVFVCLNLVSLRATVTPSEAVSFIKETPTQVFFCEMWDIFKNSYFEKHLWMAASVPCILIIGVLIINLVLISIYQNAWCSGWWWSNFKVCIKVIWNGKEHNRNADCVGIQKLSEAATRSVL